MEVSDVLRGTVVMVLAGGQGERLYPLTRTRAKPAVPFAGSYRLIDFTLSNCLNSGLRKICVLTQYKSDSLNRHIRRGWDVLTPQIGEYIEIRPPQQRMDSDWYLGTAHAVYQNIYTLEHERPENVLILGGDHVYRMDYGSMLKAHASSGADLTVACIERPLSVAASNLGVVTVDESLRATTFEEKPTDPRPVCRGSDVCLCSMGIYVFRTETLVRRVIEDAKDSSQHDFGRDVVPDMVRRGDRVFAYIFPGNYWRDIGTLDGYWDAHMDLVSALPSFNLHDEGWPIRSLGYCRPPVRTVSNAPDADLPAKLRNCLIGGGSVVRSADVSDSVIGPGVRIEPGASIEQSVVLDDSTVGRCAVIRKAIIDKHNHIPQNARMGVDHDWDRRHFTVSPGGVVAIPKGSPFPPL